MSLRLSSRRRSGSRQIHRGRKKSVKFAAMPSPFSSFFSLSKALSTSISCSSGQTVNGKFYCEDLRRLRNGIRSKCPDKWKKIIWFLQYYNAPAHTSFVVRQFLTSKNITVIPQPLFAWPRPLRIFRVPQDKITTEKASSWHGWGDPRGNARGYRHTNIWELPGMHESVGNTLGSLYTCPRGLLRRRRWKLGVT